MSRKTSLQGIILAAGKGVRMKSALPKVLHSVCGQTLLERNLRAFAGVGCSKAVLVVGYGEAEVSEELLRIRESGALGSMEVVTVRQTEQHGTGHAAKVGLPEITAEAELVIIAPGDVPLLRSHTLEAAVTYHQQEAAILSFLSFELVDPRGFGRVIRRQDAAVEAIVEHRDCNEQQLQVREVNSGIYVSDSDYLNAALASLSNDNAQSEYYLTDIVAIAANQKKKVSALKVPNPREVAGANSRFELTLLEQHRRLEINVTFMNEGVSFEDPNAAYIDEGVRIGQDCFIGAGTRLRGNTRIGERVRIDGDCLINNSEIGAGTHVKLGCVIESSSTAEDCQLGPFAHLRPGSNLSSNVKIGNFVETKNSQLKQGVKAGHLSYLGDAVIDKESNVGAGTITCNYDGQSKHQTTIGQGAFIGSNSCLVAPVSIGNGAYIGAGSTITKDVPDNALGVGRGRQFVKEGWAKRRGN